eukprot:CAMPEP_0172885516 /NCGR_PEP_ID=MMETSP1075-20121228/128307_1 /TAXON_ID=2916 /ORGANISM="Ceratium fusus, Strain PA161109" /LENGTH=124 /DNA_ID=CAMNT_0013738831 /DNA_START=941 /DNA_END=1312 /DNA_ORIENTATION=-
MSQAVTLCCCNDVVRSGTAAAAAAAGTFHRRQSRLGSVHGPRLCLRQKARLDRIVYSCGGRNVWLVRHMSWFGTKPVPASRCLPCDTWAFSRMSGCCRVAGRRKSSQGKSDWQTPTRQRSPGKC